MSERCVECTDENKCLRECKPGFFIEPLEDADTGAYCSSCGSHCLKCSSRKFCEQCAYGFLRYPNECVKCDVGCATCEDKPGSCISCVGGYLLDTESYPLNGVKFNTSTERECYYRYTLLILIGSAIGVFLFFSLLCKCLVSVNRPDRQTVKGARGAGESHESILGDEFKKDPTIISDVTGIGKQHEMDHDLSVVEESQVGGGGDHDD